MQQLVLTTEDQLKSFIKECLRELLAEFIPYPAGPDKVSKLYTRAEAAALLRVSPNTVTRYIKQGKLHASVFNREYRIGNTELEKFIKKSQS